MSDQQLEDALRATFAARAATVAEGPVWRGATATATGEVTQSLTSQGSRRAAAPHVRRSSRWRAPLLAAAAVVVVSGSVIAAAQWTADPTAHPAVSGIGGGAGDGNGVQQSTAATVRVDADGAITVAEGTPATTIDVYEDALSPVCAEFEQANGPTITREIQAGAVAVRYRMVDFLDSASASGTYSTRAHAALISVAAAGDPDVFTRFHASLFDAANQPHETAATDLSDADLAHLAAAAGAPPAVQHAIADGATIPTAKKAAASNLKDLTAVAARKGRGPGVPTVAVDGTPVDTQQAGWLTGLVRGDGN